MIAKHGQEDGCTGAKGIECPGAVGCEQLDNDVEMINDSQKVFDFFVRILVLCIIIYLTGGVLIVKLCEMKKDEKSRTSAANNKSKSQSTQRSTQHDKNWYGGTGIQPRR